MAVAEAVKSYSEAFIRVHGEREELADELSRFAGVFHCADQNHSGSISLTELESSATLSAELKRIERTKEEMQTYIAIVDANNDRTLSPFEFFNLMFLLKHVISDPVELDSAAPLKGWRGSVHFRITIDHQDEAALLRVRELGLELPNSENASIKVQLIPNIRVNNTPAEQSVKKQKGSCLAWTDQILTWSIPSTLPLNTFSLRFVVNKTNLIKFTSPLGVTTLPLSEVEKAGVDGLEGWFVLLDIVDGTSHWSSDITPRTLFRNP